MIKKIDSSTYISNIISKDGECNEDIKIGIARPRVFFSQLK